MRTDAEKRSLVESGLSWDSEETKPSRKSQGGSIYDTGSLKSESANKWKKTRTPGEGLEGGKGELKKPQTLGQGNMLKKGRNPPVGVTSPITHTSQSGLKVAGEWRTHNLYMYISWNGYITRADWHISAAVFSIFLLSGSLTPTLGHRHTLSLSHTFIHSCSAPSGPLESGAMYQTPITTHSLSCLPATHTHACTHRHTDLCLFFFSPFLLVHSFLSFIFVRNGDNL